MEDFGVHVSLHTGSLNGIQGGVPSGLAGQLAEVSAVVAAFDAEVEKIEKDSHLTTDGKRAKLKAAHLAAHTAVEAWKEQRTSGIDAQTSTRRAALHAQTDKLLPKPTELQVQHMVQRLSAFDPLEVDVLYSNATDAERLVIEAAASAVGRQPRKRGEQLVWEPLVPAERVAAAVEARMGRANPEAAAALRDSLRIRDIYDATAGAASGLLRQRLPSYVGA
ncbi:MAG: hypothetical protein KA371_06240 [Acidobacteria bacterium]|nr:hypothetical protein [Acidobacteriota bacterium]